MSGGGWDGVKTCLFGHTHYSTTVKLPNGIRLVASQREYRLPDSARRTGNARDFDAGVAIALNLLLIGKE